MSNIVQIDGNEIELSNVQQINNFSNKLFSLNSGFAKSVNNFTSSRFISTKLKFSRIFKSDVYYYTNDDYNNKQYVNVGFINTNDLDTTIKYGFSISLTSHSIIHNGRSVLIDYRQFPRDNGAVYEINYDNNKLDYLINGTIVFSEQTNVKENLKLYVKFTKENPDAEKTYIQIYSLKQYFKFMNIRNYIPFTLSESIVGILSGMAAYYSSRKFISNNIK
jgi:hypothetical protein